MRAPLTNCRTVAYFVFFVCIEENAQEVLDARANHPDSSLADLYDPITMPPDLLSAHNELDKAVDRTYGKPSFASDMERIEFLFDLYKKTADEQINPSGALTVSSHAAIKLGAG